MRTKLPLVLAFAVAALAIYLSVRIYSGRVDAATQSLGGYELPDLSEPQLQRIDREANRAREIAVAQATAQSAATRDCLKARVELFEFKQKLGQKPTALDPCGHVPPH